jgi:hypothetical protein
MKVMAKAHEGILVFGFSAAWMLLARLCAKGLQRVRTFGWITSLGWIRCRSTVTVYSAAAEQVMASNPPMVAEAVFIPWKPRGGRICDLIPIKVNVEHRPRQTKIGNKLQATVLFRHLA